MEQVHSEHCRGEDIHCDDVTMTANNKRDHTEGDKQHREFPLIS